ncbi:MAG: hypothetical protein IKG67_13815 [Parasporobacterium sp.]|nr:hypothetical protein [Parasporobacterium sp.]
MAQEITSKLISDMKTWSKEMDAIAMRLKNAPEGSLNISYQNNQPIYYHLTKTGGMTQRTYIRKKDLDLIRKLAQKKYDRALRRVLLKQIRAIDRFLKDYDPPAIRDICKRMPDDLRQMIRTPFWDDDTYVRQWLSVTYPAAPFKEGAPEYYTARGERVRSKTEKIIADTLYYAGIPYRYEYPLQLKDGRIFRPDFIILNKRTRKEYILEHFGMMDDPDYCSSAIEKLSIYMQNGIFPGDQLVLTFESSSHPFSTNDLSGLIPHYFM